ncbi:hypothetical protein BDV97DRAFT_402230 [Delphinella strobiligena]|nr:hypothetical protein BDV97DRAFT_402230 [Delphinella strobiligena]
MDVPPIILRDNGHDPFSSPPRPVSSSSGRPGTSTSSSGRPGTSTSASGRPLTASSSSGPAPHRYASFDNNQLFSLYHSNSPSQAKRALEAHMKDTDRRIQEASRLGQSLLKQRKELNERLKEVENEKDDDQIGPELQKKLTDLEKEYTEVGRESARSFLPKSRIVSQDLTVPGSPSVFSSEARASPSKLAAPSRRQRNQPANRVHDIEFATEISTSLLAQVRQLQAVLAEKDDTLRSTTAEKSQLEMDIANLMHRLKLLDESEQKYKEENWNLQIQLQEITASLRQLHDKDQRLNLLLKTTQAEKDAAQRELDELKHSHGKLAEDHEIFKRQNDAEIHALRRDLANHETERDMMNKKVEELTSQNTELTRAISSRWQSEHDARRRESGNANGHEYDDRSSPEDSPPPSPSKTPARQGMLETETLKSSLTHAHRMIQNLKNNIHREKTEKLELKRLLQDARDEVETLRTGGGGGAASAMNKRRRSEQENAKFRKQALRAGAMGATRSSTHEIIMDDDEWEDHAEVSPSRAPSSRRSNKAFDHVALAQRVDSSDAFETANERDGTTTESEAFETGVESLGANSSDDLTETESTPVNGKPSRPSIYSHPGDRSSYQSTASISDSESLDHVRTPVQQQHPKLRLRNIRGRMSGRDSDIFAQEATVDESPASSIFSNSRPASSQFSDGSTPAHVGQNLMAELEGLSDEDSDAGTISRFSMNDTIPDSPDGARVDSSNRTTPVTNRQTVIIHDATPIQASKPQMVDSGMMTEPWEPEPKSAIAAAAGIVGGTVAGLAGYALGRSSDENKDSEHSEISAETPTEAMAGAYPTETVTPHEITKDLESSDPKTLTPESPRKEAVQRANMGTPRAPLQKLTEMVSQQTRPVSPTTPQRPPQFAIATTTLAETEPISPTRSLPPIHQLVLPASGTAAETEPVSPPRVLPQQFAIATTGTAAETEPVTPARPLPPQFAISTTGTAAETEPVSPSPSFPILPEVAPLAMSSLVIADTEPQEPITKGRISTFVDPFNFSAITSQDLEPITPVDEAASPILARTGSYRPDTYTDSGVSPEKEEGQKVVPVTATYTESGFSPENDKRDIMIPGTEAIRPGAVFFAANPSVPPPTSYFPPRTSSIRSISPERQAYASKGMDVYEDENANAQRPSSSNARAPFGEVSSNVARNAAIEHGKPPFKRSHTSEHGTQTMVSSDEIDSMMRNKGRAAVVGMTGLAAGATGVAAYDALTGPRRSSEAAPLTNGTALKAPRRPSSSGSIRKTAVTSQAPPLPEDHTLRIAAASSKAPSSSGTGSMGPPSMPASAYKSAGSGSPVMTRSRTPSIRGSTAHSMRAPRLSNAGSNRPTLEPPTRRSSVTSFASEIDERFNINRANLYPDDMPPVTDSRMIQAITQTMIGEYLWKYTRKTGRSSEISGTRHRRFFWVHPYTRTLYWSETDPSLHGAKQSKAKSVAIEAVRVISDANAYPPGLHSKSLVVVTPGREIVFTAPTSTRHETWFNALSYLLLRTGAEREEDVNDTLGELTKEDVDEFNPQVNGRSESRATGRARASLSTYDSRTTGGRPVSPIRKEYLAEVPTLSRKEGRSNQRNLAASRAQSVATPEPHPDNWGGSLSSRIGTLTSAFKSPSLRGSFSSARRSKSALSNRRPGEGGYDASVITEDSDDDLRAIVERERRAMEEAAGMENANTTSDHCLEVVTSIITTLTHTRSQEWQRDQQQDQ